jgi:hypothetical protein
LLTKDQVEWLQKAEKDQIPKENEYFNAHPILADLVFKQGLIQTDHDWMNQDHPITKYQLTAAGKNALDQYNETIKRDRKNNLVYPLWVTFVAALLSFAAGFVLGHFS